MRAPSKPSYIRSTDIALTFASARRSLGVCIWTAAAAACVAMAAAMTAKAQDAEEFWDESAEATARAEQLLQQMSLDDKINMMHGEVNFLFGFHNAAIESLGIPALQMADGPIGVRIADPNVNEKRSTQMPSGPALAATWDPALAQRYGELAGSEAHMTNHNVVLGPAPDLIRVQQWGRAFEAYSEDPLLSGVMAAANIRGIQSGPVVATLKHWVGYTQEKYRLGVDPTNELEAGRRYNVIADERTLQEMYIRPFDIAIRDGHPGAVMCGFQLIAGTPGCEDPVLLGDVLKGQLGFQGWVMSDYGSTYSTVPSVMAGNDQEMPGNFTPELPGDCFFCVPLQDAVEAGEVPESRVDDAMLRMLRPMIALGLFEEPPVIEPLPEAEHGAESRSIAEQGIVLLKNEPAMLPLGGDITSIAVIGSEADSIVYGGGSSLVVPTYTVSPLEGIRSRAGAGVTVEHSPGYDPFTSAAALPGPDPVPSGFLSPPAGAGEGPGLRAEYFLNPEFSGEAAYDRVEPYAAINFGFVIWEGFRANSVHFPEQPQELDSDISVRWSGSLTAPVAGSYELVIVSSGTSRLFVDDTLVASTEPALGSMITQTAALDFEAGSTHSIRIEYAFDTERLNSNVGPQFKFAWNPPAGVVSPQVQAAAELARNSDVAVILARDYASEEADRPSLNLAFGQEELIREVAAANPRTIVVLTTSSAVTTATWDEQVPAVLQAWYGGQEQGNAIARVLFGDVNPSGKLPITMPVDEASTPVSAPAQYPGIGDRTEFSEGIFVGYRGYEERGLTPRYAFGHGLSYTTFEYSDLRITGGAPPTSGSGGSGPVTPLEATVTIRNTGEVAGTETVQVYAGTLPTEVPTAAKSLAGWGKVTLAPGASQEITIQLDPQSLSYWDVEADAWQTPIGEVPIYVGSSSADIRLEGVGNSAPIAAPADARQWRNESAGARRR